jgi:hypothetical protein
VKIMFQVGYYLDYITVTFTVSFCKHKDEWGRRGMRVGYWWESQKERDH